MSLLLNAGDRKLVMTSHNQWPCSFEMRAKPPRPAMPVTGARASAVSGRSGRWKKWAEPKRMRRSGWGGRGGRREEVARAEAEGAHRGGVPLDVRSRELRHQPVRALAPPAVARHAERLGVMREPRLEIWVAEIAVDRGRHRLDLRGAAGQIPGDATREIVRRRLHLEGAARGVGELDGRALALRHRVERTDRPAPARASRELRGTKNGGVLRHVGELDRRRQP